MGDPVRLRRDRASRWLRRASACAAAGLLSACAYFNALYNAREEFEDAERYAAEGERGRADQSYLRSAEKAAKSFEKDPDGRWADDALYLLARAHFHRGSYPEARATIERLLTVTEDEGIRAGAMAYLGATELRQGDPEGALSRLDEALAGDDADGETRAFAHLWRGRARTELGDREAAWEDFTAAFEHHGRWEREARLEAVRTSVLAGDAAHAGEAMRGVVERGYADGAADSLFALADTAGSLWGGELAEAVLEPLEDARWPDDRRAALSLTRARFYAAGGDTAAAVAQAREAAERSAGPAAASARLDAARGLLATSPRVDDLREVRNLLLPALADGRARSLIRRVEVVGVLVETGLGANQPLALFTAGEIARDELHAPGIARGIFLAQAERYTTSPWSAKAALAAAQLEPPPDQRARIETVLARDAGDPYVAAARGEPSARYGDLESQLGRMVSGLRRWGVEEAERRDGVVLQTVLLMDSIRVAEATDSLTVVCGMMLDSLAREGLVADSGLVVDSTRAACIRSDTARVDSILRGEIDLTPDSLPPDSLAPDTLGRAAPTDSGGGSGAGESDAAAEALRIGGFRPAR